MRRGDWGIGIDIESVDRFRKEVHSSGRLLSTAFSKREQRYCLSKADPAVHFAGTFAAKEAALKALSGLGIGRFVIMGFEVRHDRSGRPSLGYLGRNASALRDVEIKISISHTAADAVAMAVARVEE
jgi:holo-[acyl-carrier protein] synthase